jgi:predicted nucleic acid-binding protein
MAHLHDRDQATVASHGDAASSGSWLIVVLDTGGVQGLAPIDETRRARLRLLRGQADDFVVPAAVLAESVLTGHPGHDFHVQRLLELLDITDVDAPTGHAAGALRRAAVAGGQHPPPSGVDATVAATADARAANDDVLILTSDGDDFEQLGSLTSHPDRIAVLVV